jgi:hypothetical protein
MIKENLIKIVIDEHVEKNLFDDADFWFMEL